MTTILSKSLTSFHDEYANVPWNLISIEENHHPNQHTIKVNYPVHHHKKQLIQQLTTQPTNKSTPPINLVTEINRHQPQGLLQPLKKIKNIIAIHSNKGGVGKSTIATNIASSLAQTGLNIGLLDGDLYGPNQPDLLGINTKSTIDNDVYQPISVHGISVMSMGFLVDQKTPLIWRGPMASAYFQKMVFNTNWPQLDYLILDCPPGTGDILLTMAQKVPISGVVLVCTPQCLSVRDSIKGITMLEKMNIPILGYIENMAGFECSQCKHINHIFPENSLQQNLGPHSIDLLGKIPLDQRLINSTEKGTPHALHQQDSLTQKIQKIATRIGAKLATRPQAKPHIF